jgi:homoserine dehydrogenase
VPHLAFQADALSDLPILGIEEVTTAYYLKIQAADKPGVLADITRILGERDISIEAMIQKEPAGSFSEDDRTACIIMLTHNVIEGSMNQAIQQIESLDTIRGEVTKIRMEQLSR